ncbi:MAG: CBS domain-containing protein [Planctomycetota bacterium]|nr:CBS domain-containing protein [Planctomycetota bacterium]
MFETEGIMTTDVVAVNRQTPVYDAVEILLESGVTGLPVVDDDMTLAGIITEKDVLTLLSGPTDESAAVEQFMTCDVVSFETDVDLIEICECLTQSNFRRVPIVSQGKLRGVISRKDIIKYIIEPIG